MKNKLVVPNISKFLNKKTSFKQALKWIDYHHIDQYSWEKPDEFRHVRFKIAHDGKNIYLHYDVIELEMAAKYLNHNDPVCKDSCVEFFISFKDDPNYYNFEFNHLGTILLGIGPDRHQRQLIDSKIIDLIKVKTKIKRINQHGLTTFNWQLFIKIPIKTFSFNTIESFENLKARGNFYKCGDELSTPHYISWNPIESEKPDFHLKSYFGDIDFN
ncbi:carbohydrate-binding family 9-like protein [Algibacter miyuki]|uniref:Carbohydrate-binding family 9-like protein n=1 Tax=Algibacter miyuki TaxID=1306933 RepID=A0ABV5H2R6_9FLAO|nr:carbohydrate-binding family 9-like protein [Algibacter miyuki]MDN3663866.1 carbohydrate-binding family 9-like protein [Algibacter miyuki]